MAKCLENLLGAVCLSMADRMEQAASEAAGLEGQAASALSGKESAMLGMALVKLMHRLTPDKASA